MINLGLNLPTTTDLNVTYRVIRDFDLKSAYEINKIFETELSILNEVEFQKLIDVSRLSIGAFYNDILIGFVIIFCDKSNYFSSNFQWFQNKFKDFFYIDRIAILNEWQNMHIGKDLYSIIEQISVESKKPVICCEYNMFPSNIRSAKFHQSFGFKSVGVRRYLGNRMVNMQALFI